MTHYSERGRRALVPLAESDTEAQALADYFDFRKRGLVVSLERLATLNREQAALVSEYAGTPWTKR